MIHTITKMNGIGNDFLILDMMTTVSSAINVNDRAIEWCDRDTGLGSSRKGADGLAVLHPSTQGDFRMQIINADGTEPEMCGNAIRCVAVYAFQKGYVGNTMAIETLAGIRQCVVDGDSVRVDMGEPVTRPLNSLVVNDRELKYQYVSMGNPHAVIEVDNVADVPLADLGTQIGRHADFPEGVNVEFIQKDASNALTMRVWERGVGETQACGTGACASLVAGVLNYGVQRAATVSLLGGDLFIEWDASTNTVYMTGPTEFEYTVQVDL